MPVTKYALIRYHVIDKAIRNRYRPYPSVEDLMDACSEVLGKEVSKSTIEKDIRAMRTDEGLGYLAPIKFDKSRGGYCYEDPEYNINKIPLNNDDVEAIRFAANMLYQFKDIPVFRQYENAIGKILDKTLAHDANDDEDSRYIRFEQLPTVRGNEYLGKLLNAIRNRKEVRFDYFNYKRNDLTVRSVQPYLLKEYRFRWYLVARENEAYKVFGLERMSHLELTGETFLRDRSFDHNVYFENSIGITAKPDEKPEKIVLKVHPVLLKYLESQPLHHSQKLDKNHALATFEVIPTYEFEQWILSMGEEVEVIKPKSLANKIKQRLENALKNYEKQ